MTKNTNRTYNQLQKCWDTPTKKWPFLLQIAASHRSVRYNTDLPPPPHSKLFFQVLSMVLYCYQLWQGVGGGSQAQDHGQAIYAKIRYSVSSTFATGCSRSPTIYKCFVLFYCLNLLAQFDKLHPRTLKKSTPEDQTEGKNDKFSNLRSIGKKKLRLQDTKITWKQDFTNHHRFRDFQIGPKFSDTNIFQGTILYPYNGLRI